MKNDGVNRDTTIEVGDLVRVVAHLPHDPGGFEGNDFIVEQGEGRAFLLVGANGTEWLFYPEELEIMQEKAEMESVYAEEKRLEEKKDSLYDLCYSYNASAGFMSDLELGEGVEAIMMGHLNLTEKTRLQKKKDLAYELCKKIHEGYIHWDDKMAALKEIFDD